MKRMKTFIKNLSFRKKILLISLGVGLIPIILLGTFSYGQMRQLLIEREYRALRESLNQEAKTLDYKLESYLAAMNLIVWNESMRYSLSKNYSNNYDMYLTYRDVIDPMFHTLRTLNGTIDSITIYTDNSIHPHGDILRPLSDIKEAPWYGSAENSNTPFFVFSENNRRLLLVCKLYYRHSNYTNIICMSINYNGLFNTIKGPFDESYGIALLDNAGNAVFQYANFPNAKENYRLTPQELQGSSLNKGRTSKYVVESTGLSSVAWTAYLYRPVEIVSAPANNITFIVVCIVFLSLLIILLACVMSSKVIVRPLRALHNNMKLIEQGDLTITVKQTSSDEIGHLIQAFSHMVERLKYLIDEVLRSKIALQEYEMKALQAQINPHFLYNSLSLINGKAIMTGQEDISQMAQLLSTFYRTTLNKGKNLISVKDELQNTRSYAEIQKMMHSDSFDIVYDIDESMYSYTMPNLLLQPIVENAILHGIDHKETPDRGVLTISCYQEEDRLIFKVMDNGCGMTEDQCEAILTSESPGYGIHNVHHRVQLYYGSEYGLRYNSTKGRGTCATLTIPKR
ncbi:cache domain-containing sensor histidine kinase [Clostridium prolinivorans]|uniref:cache domain-containing sensor histidine kinase n=1 Tax=Clostridium prolinivorans TaxID=2769420 RepID=UPI000FD8B2C4|nr:sensor histidine kinase [Clostridium prolinivorans]